MTNLLASAFDPQPNPSAFLAWFGFLCGIYIFGQGMFLLRRRRREEIGEDCPIRNAKPGLLRVSGSTEGDPTLKAPVSGKACFYYRTTVLRQEDPEADDSWETVAEETKAQRFELNDDTGRLLVEPTGAVIEWPHDTYEEYGHALLTTHTDVPPALEEFLARYQVKTNTALRVEECLIGAGAEVFASGMCAVNPKAREASGSSAMARMRVPEKSKIPEFVPKIVLPQVIQLSPQPRVVPAAEMTMQSRLAAALALAKGTSPERNGDAPLAAPSISVAIAPREGSHYEKPKMERAQQDADKSQQPAAVALSPFVLVIPPDGTRFTISYRGQPAAPRPSAARAIAFLVTGPTLTLVSIYSLLNFGWL